MHRFDVRRDPVELDAFALRPFAGDVAAGRSRHEATGDVLVDLVQMIVSVTSCAHATPNGIATATMAVASRLLQFIGIPHVFYGCLFAKAEGRNERGR